MNKISMILFSVVFCTLFFIGCQVQPEILSELESASESISEIVSETLSDEISDSGSETLPDEISDSDSETLSDEVSDSDSETLPDEISDSDSETLSDEVSEKSSTALIAEDGIYTGKEDVALYIHTYNKLPSNYITKNEAQKQGWDNKKNTMAEALPGMSIGGDHFGNYEGNLPKDKGRTYKECDIDYEKGGRNAKRIVFSNDGLIFYTEDHYNTFEQLY